MASATFIVISVFNCLLAGLRKNYSVDFKKSWWLNGRWPRKKTLHIGCNPDHVMLG